MISLVASIVACVLVVCDHSVGRHCSFGTSPTWSPMLEDVEGRLVDCDTAMLRNPSRPGRLTIIAGKRSVALGDDLAVIDVYPEGR